MRTVIEESRLCDVHDAALESNRDVWIAGLSEPRFHYSREIQAITRVVSAEDIHEASEEIRGICQLVGTIRQIVFQGVSDSFGTVKIFEHTKDTCNWEKRKNYKLRPSKLCQKLTFLASYDISIIR